MITRNFLSLRDIWQLPTATATSSTEMEFLRLKRLYCTPAPENFGSLRYLSMTYTKNKQTTITLALMFTLNCITSHQKMNNIISPDAI